MQERTSMRGTFGAAGYRPRFSRAAVVGAALIAALLFGCSSEEETPDATAQVSGTVTVKGRPLRSGVVMLLNSGNSWQATLDRTGKFRISTPLPPATYLVYLREANGEPHRLVPVKYQSDTSTDYTLSVQPGNNEAAIDLK